MRHLIEFCKAFSIDVEISPRDRLERVKIRAGTIVRAQVAPTVVETAGGPVEVADLYFDDGFVARAIPFEHFRFVEEANDLSEQLDS
jgi:hypothetical protein